MTGFQVTLEFAQDKRQNSHSGGIISSLYTFNRVHSFSSSPLTILSVVFMFAPWRKVCSRLNPHMNSASSLTYYVLGKPRFYQPTITRLPSLTVLFLLTLALIGLTELAVRRFPALHSEGIVQTLHEKQQRHEPRLILARNRRPLPQLGKETSFDQTAPSLTFPFR